MTISAVSHIVKHRIPLPLNAKSKYYVVSTPTAGGSINHPSPSTLEAPPNEPNECHSLRFDERTKQRYQEMFFFFKYSSHTVFWGLEQVQADGDGYLKEKTQCICRWCNTVQSSLWMTTKPQLFTFYFHFFFPFLPAALPSWCISHLHHAEMCLRSFGPSHKRVRSHFLLVMSGQVLS